MNPNQSFTGLKKSTQNSLIRPCCVKGCKEPLRVKITDPATSFNITKNVLLSMKNTSLTVSSNCVTEIPCLNFGDDSAANALCIQQLFGLTTENCCVVLKLNVLGSDLKLCPESGNNLLLTEDVLIEGSHTLKLCAANVTPGSEQVLVCRMEPLVGS